MLRTQSLVLCFNFPQALGLDGFGDQGFLISISKKKKKTLAGPHSDGSHTHPSVLLGMFQFMSWTQTYRAGKSLYGPSVDIPTPPPPRSLYQRSIKVRLSSVPLWTTLRDFCTNDPPRFVCLPYPLWAPPPPPPPLDVCVNGPPVSVCQPNLCRGAVVRLLFVNVPPRSSTVPYPLLALRLLGLSADDVPGSVSLPFPLWQSPLPRSFCQ